jgi:hypothetical protein
MRLIYVLMLSIVFCSSVVCADTQGNDTLLKIFPPYDVYVNESSNLLIQVLDSGWNFVSGAADEINVTIMQNQTYLVHDDHPIEITALGQPFYEYNFTTDHMGEYVVYVNYQWQSDANVFISRFRIPRNISNQQSRVEDILGLEHNDRAAMAVQVMYQISLLNVKYQNLTRKQETFSIVDSLRGEVVSAALQVVFYSALFMVTLIISSLVYTRPKTYKEQFDVAPVKIARGVQKEVRAEMRYAKKQKPYQP